MSNEPNKESNPTLDYDTFSEVINGLIKDSEIAVILNSPKGTEEVYMCDNMDNVATIQFYILLQAIFSVGRQLYKDLQTNQEKWEEMVDALLSILRDDLLECPKDSE